MKKTATQETGTGPVTVTVDVNYYVPQKGDTLHIYGHDRVLTEDLRLGVDVKFNEETKKYEGAPMRTCGFFPNFVFYCDGFSWRHGECYTKAK